MPPKTLAEKFEEASRRPVAAEGFLPSRSPSEQDANLKDQYMRARAHDAAQAQHADRDDR